MQLNMIDKMVLLLYLEEKGRLPYWEMIKIRYCLAGAGLLDLYLKGRIRFEGKRTVLLDTRTTGDEILDDFLEDLENMRSFFREGKNITAFLTKVAAGLQKKCYERMVDHGMFWEDSCKTLLFFTRPFYRLADRQARDEVLKRMREVLLYDNITLTAEDMILVNLMRTSEMLKLILTSEELKARRERLRLLTKDEAHIRGIVGPELQEAIRLVKKSIEQSYDTATS